MNIIIMSLEYFSSTKIEKTIIKVEEDGNKR